MVGNMQDNETFGQIRKRPILAKTLSSTDFRSFYWLKEELVAFCREQEIPSTGSKEDLNTRIETFLTTGTVERKSTKAPANSLSAIRSAQQPPTHPEPLSVHTIISANYRSDQMHRAFFQTIIGPHFHFTTHFMKFIKENVGKTYQDAIDEWHRERAQKKNPTHLTQISPQFEYNRYIRAYFEHNPGKTLQDAIQAWNMQKGKPGSTAYSPDE
jgi:SAP domain-containing new25/Domain of unknown function (DUF6434)